MTVIDLPTADQLTAERHSPAHTAPSLPQPRHIAVPGAADVTRPLGDDDARRLLARAKFAYSTRFVASHPDRDDWRVDTSGRQAPRPGDVVLARVVELGQHKRLEGPGSRRQTLFPGDPIVVAYGSRYAADQFFALTPPDLGPCHLAAAGGLASRVVEQHESVDEPTVIEPVGLLVTAEDEVVTLRGCAPLTLSERPSAPSLAAGAETSAVDPAPATTPTVVAVLGTSMNSGKSTTLACLAHGLAAAGLRVHVGKATGTGAGNDARLFADAGAHRVLDFTDYGFGSTFGLELLELRRLFSGLVAELSRPEEGSSPDVVLVEIADGIFQGDTRGLLTSEEFRAHVDHVVFAAGDALGAAGGVTALEGLGIRPALVSGVLTASPLAAREADAAVPVPVVGTYELCDPRTALAGLGLDADGLDGRGPARG